MTDAPTDRERQIAYCQDLLDVYYGQYRAEGAPEHAKNHALKRISQYERRIEKLRGGANWRDCWGGAGGTGD